MFLKMQPGTRNLVIATLLCALGLLHCDRAPNHSLLTPTGATGGTTCKSQFNKIQVVGDFNGWSIPAAPMMADTACVWTATVMGITAGDHKFKFVTNGAFDNPQDYGSDEVCHTALSGTVSLVSGTGTGICVTFLKAGNYKFTLDETALTFKIQEVIVAQPATIRGSVGFGGTPAAGLKATVQLLLAGTPTVVGTDTTAAGFEFTGLQAGSYDVKFTAAGYLDSLKAGVQVAAGQTLDLGPTVLRAGCASQYHTIQLAGNFNTDLYGNFDLTRSPQMTKISGCVWQGTVNSVTAGQHYFKMVTDGAFDTPPDYGGVETQCLTLAAGVTLVPVLQVHGTGTAICMTFPEAGNYRFTLDEAALTVSIEKIVVSNPGSVTGTLTFGGTPSPATLKASVKVFAAGTQNQLGADSSSGTGATQTFSITGISPGSVDVRVSAQGYRDTTRAGVTVIGGQAASIGTLALTKVVGCVSRAHSGVILTGNFFSKASVRYNLASSPHMSRLGTCLWQVTVDSVLAHDKYLKFVVDSSLTADGPADGYGSSDDASACDINVFPTGSTTLTGGLQYMPGTGGYLCVTFPALGRYRFTLDEQTLSYTIERVATYGPVFPHSKTLRRARALVR